MRQKSGDRTQEPGAAHGLAPVKILERRQEPGATHGLARENSTEQLCAQRGLAIAEKSLRKPGAQELQIEESTAQRAFLLSPGF